MDRLIHQLCNLRSIIDCIANLSNTYSNVCKFSFEQRNAITDPREKKGGYYYISLIVACEATANEITFHCERILLAALETYENKTRMKLANRRMQRGVEDRESEIEFLY